MNVQIEMNSNLSTADINITLEGLIAYFDESFYSVLPQLSEEELVFLFTGFIHGSMVEVHNPSEVIRVSYTDSTISKITFH